MARNPRFIKKEDNPTQEEIAEAKAIFKKQLIDKDYNYRNWIFHFDVGEVFKDIKRDIDKNKDDPYKDKYVYIFEGNAKFDICRFEVDTHFDTVYFMGEVSFIKASFKSTASFGLVKFFGEVSFMEATFVKDASFILASFELEASFWSANFGKNTSVDFAKTNFKTMLNFEDCNSGMKHCQIIFERVVFKDTVLFTGSYFQELVFNNCFFEKQVHLPNGDDIANPNREFFRIAKNEALKLNNQIAAHDFHVKEMQAYEKEEMILPRFNWKEWRGNKLKILASLGIRKWFSTLIIYIIKGAALTTVISIYNNIVRPLLNEIFTLLFSKKKPYILGNAPLMLNKYSTYYGSRWWQGAIFTFCMAHLFLLQDCIGGVEIKYPLNIAIHFYHIVPLTFVDITKEVHSLCYYFIGIFARIMVIYGVYQTVAAFRRLGKFQ